MKMARYSRIALVACSASSAYVACADVGYTLSCLSNNAPDITATLRWKYAKDDDGATNVVTDVTATVKLVSEK